ncbi:hypothetical protein, partial [Microbacterium alcoholitolerans]|uniref:hypothetical protein n=1 Tax=unclassified Microbacterium TaxID=2609290 RepID=UPI003D16C123
AYQPPGKRQKAASSIMTKTNKSLLTYPYARPKGLDFDPKEFSTQQKSWTRIIWHLTSARC